MDKNGGFGLAGFYFYYFLFKTTTNAFLLSPVFCNNVFCFHSTTTFLFVLSLHRYLHCHHISIFSLRRDHFYRISIVSRHHIMTTQKCWEKIENKKKVGRSHHACNLTLLYSLSFVQIKTELYPAKI